MSSDLGHATPSRLSWSGVRPTVASRDPLSDDQVRAWSTTGQRRRSLLYGGAAALGLLAWAALKATGAIHSQHDLPATSCFVPADVIVIAAALGAAARCAPEHSSGTAWRLLAWA